MPREVKIMSADEDGTQLGFLQIPTDGAGSTGVQSVKAHSAAAREAQPGASGKEIDRYSERASSTVRPGCDCETVGRRVQAVLPFVWNGYGN